MTETRRIGSRVVVALVLLAAASLAVVAATDDSSATPEVVRGFEDPAMLIDELSRALTRGDVRGMLQLHDPASLEVLRPVLLEQLHDDGSLAAEILRRNGPDSAEPCQLHTVEILGWVLDRVLGENPELIELFAVSRIEVLGSIAEGTDLLHFLLRVQGGEVRVSGEVLLQTLRRTKDGWLALPSANIDALVETLQAQWSQDEDRDELASRPASAGTAPDCLSRQPMMDPIVPDTSVTPPRLVEKVAPIYPERARLERAQGRSILQAVIDTNGRVNDVRVLRSSATDLLDGAAMQAVRQWRYEPATRDGAPIAVYFTIVVEFELNENREP